MDYVVNVCEQILDLLIEMSPYLLLGFLIAGLLHAFVPNSFYSKYLSGNNLKSVINAAIFGIPLPLCSCGVIPTAMSLRREGASKGATVSFLIATPQTGIDSIFATYSLMGLPFALVRPVAALITAVLGGQFVNALENNEVREENVKDCEDDKSCDQNSASANGVNGIVAEDYSKKHDSTLWGRIKEALKFGFVEMIEDIGKWLVIGLILAGIITTVVPDSYFAAFKGNTLMSMLLVLCISIPMYLCATGSIPIAVALMMKGLTPGAALVLLMAGPASNAASILVINKVMGKKTLVLYLVAIVVGAVFSGVVIDLFLPQEWFTGVMMMTKNCCHEERGLFGVCCTIILVCLLLNVVRMKLLHQSSCSCGHEHNIGTECHCGEHKGSCCHKEHIVDGKYDHGMCEAKVYHIGGMNCNHCRNNVEKAIRTLKGVEEVIVDLQTGEAKVIGDTLDEIEIQKAVESLGFTFK